MNGFERLKALGAAIAALADQPDNAEVRDNLVTLRSEIECEPTIAEELRAMVGRMRRLEAQADAIAMRCALVACALPGNQTPYNKHVLAPLDVLAADIQRIIADLEGAADIAEGAGVEVLAAAVCTPDPIKVRSDLADARDKLVAGLESLTAIHTAVGVLFEYVNNPALEAVADHVASSMRGRLEMVAGDRDRAAKNVNEAADILVALVPGE